MFVGWCVRWSVATVFFVAVMIGSGYYVFNEALQGSAYVQVPDVTQRPITEASFKLAELQLEMEQKHVPDERIPKYYVITQHPAPGKVVRTGRKVTLTISAGTDSLTPPNLTGKTIERAKEEIKRMGFELGNVARIPHTASRDTVLAQDPAVNRLVSSNSRINLLLSEGRASQAIIMPDLMGKPIRSVLEILTPLGIKPIPNRVERPDARMDVVLDQEPPAGTLIHKGERVVYTVRASGDITLPDAQRKVEVSYTVPPSWFSREVRIDTIDRNETRLTIFPLEHHYINGLPPRFGSGYTISAPLKFIDKMTVEIYLDGQLAQSYVYEGDAEPIVTQYTIH